MTDTLRSLQHIRSLYEEASTAARQGQPDEALDRCEEGRVAAHKLDSFQSSNPAVLLDDQAAKIRDSISAHISQQWKDYVVINVVLGEITVNGTAEGNTPYQLYYTCSF